MTKKNENTTLGLLLGTAVGVGLGVLFAPNKGSVTRQKIIDNANSAKEAIASDAETIKNNIASSATHLKQSVADTLGDKKTTLDDHLDAVVADASYKADDVIESLERRLKTLKTKNKTFQKKAK